MWLKGSMGKASARIVRLRERLAELVAEAGTVGQRYVRCGKQGCHCRDGEGHGPVLYLSVSLGTGQTKQVTLTPETYEVAQHYARNYSRLREVLEEISAIHREIFQEERREIRRRRRSTDSG